MNIDKLKQLIGDLVIAQTDLREQLDSVNAQNSTLIDELKKRDETIEQLTKGE